MKKRIPPRLSKHYPPILLWLGDLEEIESTFKSWASSVKFKTTDTEYDAVSELAADIKEDNIFDLEIVCSSPYASVDLQHWSSALLYVTASENPANAGVFHSIDAILKRGARKFQSPLIQSGLLLACFAIPFGIVRITGMQWVGWFAPVLTTIWSVVFFGARLAHYNIIRLQHRGGSKSFWKRNKDQIITTLLTTLITASISVGVGYFLGLTKQAAQMKSRSNEAIAFPSPSATSPP